MIYQTRSEAITNNAIYYYGKKCNLHVDWVRSVKDSQCTKCKVERTLKNRDPIKHRTSSLESYHLNKSNHLKIRSERRKAFYATNKDHVLVIVKEWQQNNKNKTKAIKAARRARKLMATPPWAQSGKVHHQIQAVYKSCPDGYEVDHIVPLASNRVCGLHVPWNLQYLTKSENCSKGNKFVDITEIV